MFWSFRVPLRNSRPRGVSCRKDRLDLTSCHWTSRPSASERFIKLGFQRKSGRESCRRPCSYTARKTDEERSTLRVWLWIIHLVCVQKSCITITPSLKDSALVIIHAYRTQQWCLSDNSVIGLPKACSLKKIWKSETSIFLMLLYISMILLKMWKMNDWDSSIKCFHIFYEDYQHISMLESTWIR
jgi:hypothetical protein